MNMCIKASLWLTALSSFSLALFACNTPTPPPEPSPPQVVIAPVPPGPEGTSAGPTSTTSLAPAPTALPSDPGDCKLPAPKKSGDPCKTDADCGPSAPCHAPACVAKAKSPPKPADLMCSMTFACETADANRCGCYEGSCALIPPP
jgi:hypothetical protein